MSYSRWSNSSFYTYWCSSDAKCKEDELFDICGVKMFIYSELNTDIEKCLKEIEEIGKKDNKIPYTDDEIYIELRGYMNSFIANVTEEYDGRPLKNINICRDCSKYQRKSEHLVKELIGVIDKFEYQGKSIIYNHPKTKKRMFDVHSCLMEDTNQWNSAGRCINMFVCEKIPFKCKIFNQYKEMQKMEQI